MYTFHVFEPAYKDHLWPVYNMYKEHILLVFIYKIHCIRFF